MADERRRVEVHAVTRRHGKLQAMRETAREAEARGETVQWVSSDGVCGRPAHQQEPAPGGGWRRYCDRCAEVVRARDMRERGYTRLMPLHASRVLEGHRCSGPPPDDDGE